MKQILSEEENIIFSKHFFAKIPSEDRKLVWIITTTKLLGAKNPVVITNSVFLNGAFHEHTLSFMVLK